MLNVLRSPFDAEILEGWNCDSKLSVLISCSMLWVSTSIFYSQTCFSPSIFYRNGFVSSLKTTCMESIIISWARSSPGMVDKIVGGRWYCNLIWSCLYSYPPWRNGFSSPPRIAAGLLRFFSSSISQSTSLVEELARVSSFSCEYSGS